MKPILSLPKRWLLLAAPLCLLGCASGYTPLADVLSGVMAEQFGTSSSAFNTNNPQYRYLRVEVVGKPAALLVLGYLDAHPQGDIEVWYSSSREVIKIQNGRIVGTSGLNPDWQRVQYPVAPPTWVNLPAQGVLYARERDEMPGYRAAIRDQLQVKPWAGLPTITLPATLPVGLAKSYRWFSEASLSSTEPLPPAWFALSLRGDQPAVVYSEQCLSVNFCLKLQSWPILESAL